MAQKATPRIDYRIEKHQITEASETPHQTKQWLIVQQQHAGEIARVRLALYTLPYVTSYELPFRLLLIRAPQAIEKLRNELTIHSRWVEINGSKRGVLYSLDADVAAPEAFYYRRSHRIFRSGTEGGTENSYTSIARQSSIPRERLRLALSAGLLVTALDALLFFGVQRIASDIAVLRKGGMKIDLLHVEAFDTQTQTLREIPAYRLVMVDSDSAVSATVSLVA